MKCNNQCIHWSECGDSDYPAECGQYSDTEPQFEQQPELTPEDIIDIEHEINYILSIESLKFDDGTESPSK